MNTLIVIPARAGSKGLPNKNTLLLGSKPLISYSIEYALKIKKEHDIICVTTNDIKVIEIVADYKEVILIKRPKILSSDYASMNDVLKHSVLELSNKFILFDKILLLQPTSPFREIEDYRKISKILTNSIDLVVSVKVSKSNPYFNLFEENIEGYLVKSKEGTFVRRQDCPHIYEYNGSMYYMWKNSLLNFGLHKMPKILKMIMPDERSIDIDNISDWNNAKQILNSKNN